MSSKFVELANIVRKSIAEEMCVVHTKQIIRNEGERFYLIDQSIKDDDLKQGIKQCQIIP